MIPIEIGEPSWRVMLTPSNNNQLLIEELHNDIMLKLLNASSGSMTLFYVGQVSARQMQKTESSRLTGKAHTE